MATRFYLCNEDSAIAGQKKLSRGRPLGPVVTSDAVATVAGPTGGVTYKVAGAQLLFITLPLYAVTISGTITINIWASQSGDANAGPQLNLERWTRAGGYISTPLITEEGVELSVGGRTLHQWTVAVGPAAYSQGDRLGIDPWINDAGGNMVSGFTSQMSWGSDTAGVDGDSWIEFSQDGIVELGTVASASPDWEHGPFPFILGDGSIFGRGRPNVSKYAGVGPVPMGSFERFIFPRLHPVFSVAGITILLGPALETDDALPLTKLKQKTLNPALETDTALLLAANKSRPLGIALENDTVFAFARAKSRVFGIALETDLAQPLARFKSKALGLATETDLAQPLGRLKSRALGIATESDLAQALGKAKVKALGLATETDLAQTLARAKSRTLGAALETDAAQAFARAKTRLLGIAQETDLAMPFAGAAHAAVRVLRMLMGVGR